MTYHTAGWLAAGLVFLGACLLALLTKHDYRKQKPDADKARGAGL